MILVLVKLVVLMRDLSLSERGIGIFWCGGCVLGGGLTFLGGVLVFSDVFCYFLDLKFGISGFGVGIRQILGIFGKFGFCCFMGFGIWIFYVF